jgi:hypothetical protein
MKKIFLCIIAMALVVIADAQQQFAEVIPCATLAGKSCCAITLDEINIAGKLQISSKNLQIVHFALTMVRDGVYIHRITQSDKISAPMMDQLKQLRKGQRFIFDEIRALKPNGGIISLKSLSFILN